jgi:head-tail adaptor
VIFAHGETVTAKRAPLVADEYGNQVRDWSNAAAIPHDGCAVAQGAKGSATEDLTGDRDPIISDRIVVMPSGTDVVATDRLQVRGREYEVVGEPFDWVNPFTGTAFGVVVYCNRVEG